MSTPAIKPPFGFETTVGAIRLALEGSKDDETRLSLIYQLIENTEANYPADTNSVQALLWALKESDGRFEVIP